MTSDQKEKARKIMKHHLTSKGWPNVPKPNELVIAELANMFSLLVTAGLVNPIHYPEYEQAAIIQYTIWSGR